MNNNIQFINSSDYFLNYQQFLLHQILIVSHQDGISFNSRIESKNFYQQKTKMDEKEISNKCKEIHNQLKTQFTNN